MCGIVYGKRTDGNPIAKNLLKRYENQRGRGSDGFGYVTIDKGYVGEVKRFETENQMRASLKKETASEILFHHRFPTSTPNLADLNHPIEVKNKSLKYNYIVVHNGVLRNEDALRAEHEEKGFTYTTLFQEITIKKTKNSKTEEVEEQFNDSESLAIELALFFEGKVDKINAIGTIAFICIQTNKKGKVVRIFCGKNVGNPLVVEDCKEMVFIKSAGTGTSMVSDEIQVLDYENDKLSAIRIDVGSTTTPYQFSGNNPRHEDRDDEWKDYYTGVGFDTRRNLNTHVTNLSAEEQIVRAFTNRHKALPAPSVSPSTGGSSSTPRTLFGDDAGSGNRDRRSDRKENNRNGGSDTTDWLDDPSDSEYAYYRLGEVEAELREKYIQYDTLTAELSDWNEMTEDPSLKLQAVIEKEIVEAKISQLDDDIDGLEGELQEICETTGIESTLIDYHDRWNTNGYGDDEEEDDKLG